MIDIACAAPNLPESLEIIQQLFDLLGSCYEKDTSELNEIVTVIVNGVYTCCKNMKSEIPRSNFAKLLLSQLKKISFKLYNKKDPIKSLNDISDFYGKFIPSLCLLSSYYNGYSISNNNHVERDLDNSLNEVYRDTWFLFVVV